MMRILACVGVATVALAAGTPAQAYPPGRLKTAGTHACSTAGNTCRAGVREALVAALEARGCPALARRVAELPAAALAPPVALGASQRLEVLAIRPDLAQHRTLFRLLAAGQPHGLPFWVSVPGDLPAPAARVLRPPRAHQARGRAPRRGPLLVWPHRPALLTLLGAGMRIQLLVIPLQQGHRGQIVRLQDPKNHRFITGTVTGKNQLEAAL